MDNLMESLLYLPFQELSLRDALPTKTHSLIQWGILLLRKNSFHAVAISYRATLTQHFFHFATRKNQLHVVSLPIGNS